MKLKHLMILLFAILPSLSQPVGLLAEKEAPKKVAKKVAKKSKKKSKKKRTRKKRPKKVEKVSVLKKGKFDIKGGVKSFKKSADFLINYMKDTKSVKTTDDKNALWVSLARYYHYTERVKAYKTEQFNKIALKLFQEASLHKDLFNKSKVWLIEKWINQKQKSISMKEEPEEMPEKEIKKESKKTQAKKTEKRRKKVKKS